MTHPNRAVYVNVNGRETDTSEFAFVHARKKPVVIRAVRIAVPFDVETLEGKMHGNAGDWLIEGVNGELYPCKPDIFERTYEVLA